jgi:type I restriction enzyme S subunit
MSSNAQGWRPVALGNVCHKIGSGATPRGGQDSYTPTGVALIRSQNVLDLRLTEEGLARIPDDAAVALRNVTVEAGDVLLNITGQSVARCCVVPETVLPARVNQHVAIVRPDIEKLDSRFLQYALIANKPRLLGLASGGATREALTKAMIAEFEIEAPEIQEQRRISAVLGSLEEKIENNRRLAETLENILGALFKAQFVDFVGYEDLVESDIGLIPRGWSVSPLSDLGGVHRDLRRGPTNSPYIGLDDMPRGSMILTKWKTVGAPEGQSANFTEGDILFGKLRPYFRKVGVALIDGRCSTEILVLRPDDPSYYGFLLGHVISQRFIDHCVAVSRGTRMPRAEWKDAGAYGVAVPPQEVSAEFTAFTKTFYEVIRGLVHELHTLAAIRDLLLPRLTSGQIRVPPEEQLTTDVA